MARDNDLAFGEIDNEYVFRNIQKRADAPFRIFKPFDNLDSRPDVFTKETISQFKSAITDTIKNGSSNEVIYKIKVGDNLQGRKIRFVPYRRNTCLFFIQLVD